MPVAPPVGQRGDVCHRRRPAGRGRGRESSAGRRPRAVVRGERKGAPGLWRSRWVWAAARRQDRWAAPGASAGAGTGAGRTGLIVPLRPRRPRPALAAAPAPGRLARPPAPRPLGAPPGRPARVYTLRAGARQVRISAAPDSARVVGRSSGVGHRVARRMGPRAPTIDQMRGPPVRAPRAHAHTREWRRAAARGGGRPGRTQGRAPHPARNTPSRGGVGARPRGPRVRGRSERSWSVRGQSVQQGGAAGRGRGRVGRWAAARAPAPAPPKRRASRLGLLGGGLLGGGLLSGLLGGGLLGGRLLGGRLLGRLLGGGGLLGRLRGGRAGAARRGSA
jgi:hypothetical protein